MDADLLVSRREGMIEAEVDGELVALHVDKGTCYGFNPTATRIWALIEAPQRVSEIRDKLLEQYEIDSETCELQLMELLRELEQDGLIELTPHPQLG